jgi:hypothetical protein
MNLLATRIGLGIAIYLSSSTLYTHSSFAVSLKFSDRYELTQLDEAPLTFREPSPVDNSISGLLNAAESSIDVRQEPQLLEPTFSSIQQSSVEATPQELQDLFFSSASSIQVQTGSDREEENLLDYIVGAFSNLEINSINNNSFANPSVVILPQVAYEDVYKGLYDFDVDVSANPNPTANTPRAVNNSIPEEFLITQESVRDYNPRTFANTGFGSNNNDLLLPTEYTSSLSRLFGVSAVPRENNSNPSSLLYTPYLSSSNLNSLTNSYAYEYEDLATRVNEILPQNFNAYTNVDEIEVESDYKYTSASDKFNAQKDPMQVDLEEELRERERRRKEKRRNLLMKLGQEQRQREMKRRLERINTARKRDSALRQQRQRQQQTLRQQQNTLNN